MSPGQRRFLNLLAALQLFTAVQSGGGYEYKRPLLPTGHGHAFIPLSTVLPLPPVPALPALPTPRPGGIEVLPTTKSVVASYLPPASVEFQQPQQHQFVIRPQPPPLPSGYSSALNTPTDFYLPPAAIAPTLDNIYIGPEGRPLKQYAVVEIIDNDIEQETAPFLPSGYYDGARAQIVATGNGASATETSSLRYHQRLLQSPLSLQSQGITNGDGIALGSGGLGYIRLPNGNVYLGSGSLGYISSQQHQELLRDVRTRSEAALPDALHFGHGPLGANNGFPFK